MSDTLNLESLTLRLRRFPETQQSELIAWDAADELLMLNALPQVNGQLLIINDHFGALGCAAARLNPIWVNDSFVAHQALKQNLDLNGQPQPDRCLADLEPFEEQIDQVWIKLPRNLRYLEYLLDWLNGHLPQGTTVVIAARLKEMPTTLKGVTEHYLDDIQPSRIRKKARLLSGKTSGRRARSPLVLNWQAQGTDFQLENHPNTFAGQKLDVAAHLMLNQIPTGHRRIVDLGCGNGILALAAAKANPDAHILAVDESWHGVTSCQANLARALPQAQFQVLWNDCLTDLDPESADLVLCNPPFHQQQAITDHIAWQMFRDAKRTLATGGRLRVIGNRHLGYHIKLKRLFGKVETVAANAKFVILDAIK